MFRELFRIPGTEITIFTYGLLLVIGTLAGIWLAKRLARRRGLNPELFVNAGLLALLVGVVGARASHVLENWAHYTRPGVGVGGLLWEMVNIRSGGLTYYGGFILGVPVLIFYGIRKKVSIPVGMDIMGTALMVGLAFGRLGCFANGCCYGERWDGACAVHFPYYSDAYMEQVQDGQLTPPRRLMEENARGELRLISPQEAARDPELAGLVQKERALGVHPTQIYSAITAFLIAGLLLAYTPFSKTPGRVFALLLMIEPVTRFLIETLRVEPAVWGGMSLSMLLAVPQFLLGVGLWWWFGIRRAREVSGMTGQM